MSLETTNPARPERGSGGNGNAGAKGGGGNTGNSLDPLKNKAAVTLAVVSVVVLFVAVAFLWGKADDADNELPWTRWMTLVAIIEALAFAGAGFLWGREVNKGAADQAKDAQKTATEKTEEAEKAKTSAKAVLAMLDQKAAGGGAADRMGPSGTGSAAQEDLRAVAEFARTMLKDL